MFHSTEAEAIRTAEATGRPFVSAYDDPWIIAGQGTIVAGEVTDAYATLDATASFNITRELSVYLKGDNLLNNAYIVSRRPFGARPGAPRLMLGGVKVKLAR